MSITRLTKPLRRVVETPQGRYTLTIGMSGLELRKYRTRATFLLPFGMAYVRAAMLDADAKRDRQRRPTRRKSSRLKRGI